MYKLKKTYTFDAAHKLKNTQSLTSKKCTRLHGHRWKVKVEIITKRIINDMVIDFGRLKEIIDLLDHRNLNDVLKFNPTAENIAGFLYGTIETHLDPELEPKLKVTVDESPGAKVTYWE